MGNIYLEAGNHRLNLDRHFWDPKVSKKAATGKHHYTYIGSGYLKDQNIKNKFGKILALTGEIFLILLSVGSLLISKSFRNLIEHTWKSLKDGTELGVSHVFISKEKPKKEVSEKETQKDPRKLGEDERDLLALKVLEEELQNEGQDLKLPEPLPQYDHFLSFPLDMQKEIIKKLDSESLLALSKTGKAYAEIINKHFQKQKLKALIEYKALNIWKKNLARSVVPPDGNYEWDRINHTFNYNGENFLVSYISLMNSFPKEATKLYEKLLIAKKNSPEFTYLIGGLINFSMKNPVESKRLLEKAKDMTHNSHILLGIVFGLARIDPILALSIADKIGNKQVQQQAKYLTGLYSLFVDPNKGIEIINSLDKNFPIDYKKTFDIIDHFDKNFYLQLIKLPVENTNFIVEDIIQKAGPVSKENLLNAYADTHQFDKALECAKNTPPKTIEGGVELFLRALINVYVKKAEQEKSPVKSAKILEEALGIANQRFKSNSFKFESVCQIGTAFYKISPERGKKILQDIQIESFNGGKDFELYKGKEKAAYEDSLLKLAEAYLKFDHKTAKEILDTIILRSAKKIDILLKMAWRYKKGNPEVIKLLDESYSLVDRVPNDLLSDDTNKREQKMRYLLQIARLYAAHDSFDKLAEIYKKAKVELENIDKNGNERPWISVSLLAKIAYLINPQEAVELINKRLAKFDKIFVRVDALVDLSRIV